MSTIYYTTSTTDYTMSTTNHSMSTIGHVMSDSTDDTTTPKTLLPELIEVALLNLDYNELKTPFLQREQRPSTSAATGTSQRTLTTRHPAGTYRPSRKGEPTTTKTFPVTKVHPLLRAADENDGAEGNVSILFPWTLEQLILLPPGGAWEHELVAQPPPERMELLIIDSHSIPGRPRTEDDIEMLVQATSIAEVQKAWRYHGRTGQALEAIAEAAKPGRVKGGVTVGMVVGELRKLFWPRQLRARAGKRNEPKYDLQRYSEVIGLVWDVALEGGEYEAQAEAHEKWEREVEVEKAEMVKEGKVRKVAVKADGEEVGEGSKIVEVPEMGKAEIYVYTVDVDAVEAKKMRRFS